MAPGSFTQAVFRASPHSTTQHGNPGQSIRGAQQHFNFTGHACSAATSPSTRQPTSISLFIRHRDVYELWVAKVAYGKCLPSVPESPHFALGSNPASSPFV
jgi:hypothetical protein